MKYPLLLATLVSVNGMAVVSEKPNVLLIIADDLGYGDLSSYGSKTIHTPNIDMLANNGVKFTQGYACSATSTPSRYAMFTGMYPWKNKEAKILPGNAPLLVSTSQPTLPKMFQQAGYKTAAIGKWHLGMGNGSVDWNEKISPGANEIGFDYSNLIAATNDRVPTVFVENGLVVDLDPDDPIKVSYTTNFPGEVTALTNPELLKMKWSDGHNNSIHNGIPRIGFQTGGKSARWKDEEMADYFTGLAKDFIAAQKDHPFFLYFGLHQPHVPRTPNARFVGKSGMGPRGDAILEADWAVGELIAQLKKLGLLESTLIVFSSDNGPVLDDGYYDDAVEKLGDHKPADVLRGGKYSLFEAGTRVPFVWYWENHIKAKTSDAMVTQLDLFGSLATLVGEKIPKYLDTENHLNAFLGKSNNARTMMIVEAEGRTALRYKNWAYLPEYKGSERNNTGNELGNLPQGGLFDLEKDLSQQNNLISENSKMRRRLEKKYNQLTRIK